MQKMRQAITGLKSNKSGYTLIEVLVVVFMLVALTSVSIGSFSAYYHARSSKVSKTIDSFLSQSKIDSLSGKKNIVVIRKANDFDKAEDGSRSGEYYAELYEFMGSNLYHRYKKEAVGNRWVSFAYDRGSSQADIGENTLIVQFNSQTGAVDFATVTNSFPCVANADQATNGITWNVSDSDMTAYCTNTPNKMTFYVQSGHTSSIELYKLSGEHFLTNEKGR